MSAQERMKQGGEILEGRYRIISEGSPHDLGRAYQATDIRDDRRVEILILARHFGSGVTLLDRIVQANRSIASLREPTLIPFEHVGLVDGQPYLVRGQARGRPLAELLARLGSLKVDVAIEIAIRLCEALAPLHRAGLVHGGLSPYSVWVTVADQEAGEPRSPGSQQGLSRAVTVIDAGLWPALRPIPPPPGQPWGRFPYLSPEQAAGEDIHPASDVYVIGSLLYEMLAGRPPFRATERAVLVLQHLRQDPPSLQILVPHTPLPLSQIVQKALAKEPAARYRNAGQLAHILRSQLVAHPAEAAVPRPPQAVGHLVVPPPPASYELRAAPPGRQVREVHGPGSEVDEWAEESEGLDWLLIGLLILALVAVLGLIPLWRTVYRRYTIPPPVLMPGSDVETDPRSAWRQGAAPPVLATMRPLAAWLRGDRAPRVAVGSLQERLPVLAGVAVDRFRPAWYQVNLQVWESSLRVLGRDWTKLGKVLLLEA